MTKELEIDFCKKCIMERLGEMLEEGVISREEYEQKKKEDGRGMRLNEIFDRLTDDEILLVIDIAAIMACALIVCAVCVILTL